jgi:hypothetical protein
VLAVGDTSFQQRCLEKMRSVRQHGSTLVLVSHDLAAIEATCTRTLWLSRGVLVGDGPTAEVLADYRATVEAAARADAVVAGPVRIVDTTVVGPDGLPHTYEPLEIRVVLVNDVRRDVRLYLGVTEGVPSPVFVVERDFELAAGETVVACRVAQLPLPRGRFALWAAVVEQDGPDLVPWRPLVEIDVMGPVLGPGPGGVARAAPVVVDAAWEMACR